MLIAVHFSCPLLLPLCFPGIVFYLRVFLSLQNFHDYFLAVSTGFSFIRFCFASCFDLFSSFSTLLMISECFCSLHGCHLWEGWCRCVPTTFLKLSPTTNLIPTAFVDLVHKPYSCLPRPILVISSAISC